MVVFTNVNYFDRKFLAIFITTISVILFIFRSFFPENASKPIYLIFGNFLLQRDSRVSNFTIEYIDSGIESCLSIAINTRTFLSCLNVTCYLSSDLSILSQVSTKLFYLEL